MKNYFNFLPLLGLGVALVGCHDEDFGLTPEQIRHRVNFEEVFGAPDPDHTWSTAEYRYVSVDVQYPAFFDSYRCRVWTADPSRATKNLYYMADLRVENGQVSKFGIDCPADLQTVYVSLTDAQGGTVVMPATFDKEGNARVVFGDYTRANIHLDVENAEKGVDFDVDVYYHSKASDADNSDWEAALPAGSDGWGYFPKSKYDSFIKVFPENGGNVKNPPCSSFVFESKGEDLVLYPFYAVTDGINTNKIVFWVYNPKDNIPYSDIVKDYEPTELMPAGSMEVLGKAPGSFANYTEMYRASYGTTDTKSRPYIIHGVPAGWRIIFALETSSEGYFFSIKELNDPANSKSQNTVDRSKFTNGETYSMAGTATIGADTYLAFEDTWYNGQYDCQDMAFAVYGAKAVDMNMGEGQAMGFVVAYEDLGSTLDMDYNDIVLRVEHVTNSLADANAEKDVTVTLLASGGTIPVVPMYNGAAIFAGKGADSGNTGEAHTVFGADTDIPVNAGASTVSAVPVNSTIRVKEISPITTVAADIVMQLNGATPSTMKYTNPQAWGVTDASGNRTDKTPYAILISDPNWKWPAENVLITSVYPSFKTWVQNHNSATDWYGAEWGSSDIDTPTGDVVGIVALTTFYESQSIANINSEFLDDYCTNGTTLHFIFENATPGATFTVKSETGSLTKEGTVGANGKAEMELTGDEFKKILYKNGTSGDQNTYYTITVFASKYGVSFGTEAEFIESDINGTNVFADLIDEDGTEVELGTSTAGNPSIEASYFTQFADVTFTIRSTNFAPGAAIAELINKDNNIIDVCGYNGYLTSAITAVAGRPGIYRISVTPAQFAKFLSNQSGSGIQFKGFTNLKVAVKGRQHCPMTLSTSNVVINTTISATQNVTISNNGSNGSIGTPTSSAESIATATISGTTVTITGHSAGDAVITIPVEGDESYAAGSLTINVSVSSLAAPTLTIDASSVTALTSKGATTTATFTTNSSGAVSVVSNDDHVTASVEGTTVTVTGAKIGSGTATITVIVAEVADTYSMKSETFEVPYNISAPTAPSVLFEDSTAGTDAATFTTVDADCFTGATSIVIKTTTATEGTTYNYVWVENLAYKGDNGHGTIINKNIDFAAAPGGEKTTTIDNEADLNYIKANGLIISCTKSIGLQKVELQVNY